MSVASVALNRFGLGARASDRLTGDPHDWVTAQLAHYTARPDVIAAAPTSSAAARNVADFLEKRRRYIAGLRRAGGISNGKKTAEDSAAVAMRKAYRAGTRDDYVASVGARFGSALTTSAPFVERLVHFWSNHFAVSVEQMPVSAVAGPFEFEAIRPHVLGRFRDMLGAVERHPAMLLYLDQAISVGPESAFGRHTSTRGKAIGLNENLAREILELHTLGVRTGYRQADVTEFARALTGWTSRGLVRRIPQSSGEAGAFVFADALHEPGVRTIMGHSYREGGEAQGQAVLDDLARNPATARHIATKMARHFAGDPVPPAMIDRLSAAYLKSDGDLPTVYRAIVESPEAWVDRPVRFRTPWEWAIATMRGIGMTMIAPNAAVGLMNQLGQPVWKPGQPSGYDDIDQSWAGPDAVMRRVEAAERFAARATAPIDARKLAVTLHPDALSAATAQALARAESPAQALALLLVAPEAMRR